MSEPSYRSSGQHTEFHIPHCAFLSGVFLWCLVFSFLSADTNVFVLLFLLHLYELVFRALVLEDEIQNVSGIESDVVTTVIVLEVKAVGSHYHP